MGKCKNEGDMLTDEEELTCKNGILGDKTASSQNHTLFYTVSQHFGTQGHQQYHKSKLED